MKRVDNLLGFEEGLLKLYKQFHQRDGIGQYLEGPVMALFAELTEAQRKEGVPSGKELERELRRLKKEIVKRKAELAR